MESDDMCADDSKTTGRVKHTLQPLVRPEVAVLYPVPLELAMCPECGGKLFWQVTTPDRLEDLAVDCVNEGLIGGSLHRYWQGDWQPIFDTVKNWIRSNARVERHPSEG